MRTNSDVHEFMGSYDPRSGVVSIRYAQHTIAEIATRPAPLGRTVFYPPGTLLEAVTTPVHEFGENIRRHASEPIDKASSTA